MKKNLEILEYENKATNSEPPRVYTRFKTDDGWMSCFDTKECEKLKAMVNKIACVEVAESKSGDKVFHNIKKCYGAEDVNIDVTQERIDPEMTDEAKAKRSVVPKNHTTMYVSYAKDIFCNLLNSENLNADYDINTKMTNAINLVKQAKEAFE